jgi:hypothetical protein
MFLCAILFSGGWGLITLNFCDTSLRVHYYKELYSFIIAKPQSNDPAECWT